MTQNGIVVAHISTAHDIFDDRITIREGVSLSQNGFRVFIIAKNDYSKRENTFAEDISFISLPSWRNRFDRFFRGYFYVFYYIFRFNPKIVHLHDPELFLIGIFFHFFGKIVIADVHENLVHQLNDKIADKHFLKQILSKFLSAYIKLVRRYCSLIVCATEDISNLFISDKTVTIANFPRKSEFNVGKSLSQIPTIVVCGLIAQERCINEIVQAMQYVNGANLLFAGTFSTDLDRQLVKEAVSSNSQIHYLGVLGRKEVISLLSSAWIGLCLYKPYANHLTSRPAKLYEYMASSTAILASDFPEWKSFLHSNEAGEVTNPENPKLIGETLTKMLKEKDHLFQYGANGRENFLRSFSWEFEESKLIENYQKLAKVLL